MDFENKVWDDDEHLVGLLKEQALDHPSEELIEKTMARLHAQQTEKAIRYVPLRTPIYMMIGILLLLLIPFFIPVSSSDNLFDIKLLTYLTNDFLLYAIALWFVVAMCWTIKLLLPTDSKLSVNP